MTTTSPLALITAEWTKIRTVRSTVWTLLPTFVLCVSLGFLIALSFRGNFSHLGRQQQQSFDPLFATFYSLTLGQLALVVFGVLVVSSEYSSGTIRASLTAVPRRGLFYGGKLLAATLPVLGLSLITVLATFYAAQAGLGPHRTSLSAHGTPQAVLGACLYLTLIALFAMGLATMLRSPVRSLAILLPVFFLGSQGLGNVPKIKTLAQYLPDEAGMVIMHVAGPPDDPRFARAYGPWTGLGIVALWTAAAILGGYLVLRRRDA
jgi:ABC-type transport system involved in multi-copper enzyme maturation permease subunit